MRHPGFGTIGNPPDRDPVRPTSDTRPSTLPRLDVDVLARVLRGLRYPPIRQVNGNQPGASWFEPDYDRHADAIAAEYSRLLEERPKVAPESESEKREAFGK